MVWFKYWFDYCTCFLMTSINWLYHLLLFDQRYSKSFAMKYPGRSFGRGSTASPTVRNNVKSIQYLGNGLLTCHVEKFIFFFNCICHLTHSTSDSSSIILKWWTSPDPWTKISISIFFGGHLSLPFQSQLVVNFAWMVYSQWTEMPFTQSKLSMKY